MEDVKKKRVRPTWKQVRELEGQLKELQDECTAIVGHEKEAVERLLKMKDERDALEKSNRLLEDELGSLRAALDVQRANTKRWSVRAMELEHRGFWARVFNKKQKEG